jgi:hypothetical protein
MLEQLGECSSINKNFILYSSSSIALPELAIGNMVLTIETDVFPSEKAFPQKP